MSPCAIGYRLANTGDLPAIRELVAACGLPDRGIELVLEHCIVACCDSALAGAVGLEPQGRCGLLRSLAVSPAYRDRSLGKGLCARMVSHARLLGIERLYLLTTSAERFFAKAGFERAARETVPAEIQAGEQFRSICPATAVCMTRDISHEVIHASTDLLQLRPDVPGARMWAVSLRQTMLTYFEVAPNSRFDPHSHASEQITMVLTGELYFEVAGVVHCIQPGEVFAIPSSVPHAVWTGEQAVTAVDAWSPVMRKYEQARG